MLPHSVQEELKYGNTGSTRAYVAKLENELNRLELENRQMFRQLLGAGETHNKQLRALRWCYEYIECDVERPTFRDWLIRRGGW